MTQKQMAVALLLFILSVGAVGVSWNGFLRGNHCDYLYYNAERQIDDQSDLLITYAFLANPNLTAEREQAFEMIIDSREVSIRKRVDYFKEMCHSKIRKEQLKGLLVALKIYNTTKQAVFKEEQGSFFRWIQKTYPYEDDDLL